MTYSLDHGFFLCKIFLAGYFALHILYLCTFQKLTSDKISDCLQRIILACMSQCVNWGGTSPQ